LASFSIYIRRETKAKDGKAQLRLSISHANVRKWVKLSIRVKERDWNPKNQSVRKGGKESTKINEYIQGIVAKCHEIETEIISKGSIVTAALLKELIEREIDPRATEKDFISYARQVIKDYQELGKISTYKRMTVIVNKLEAYRKAVLFEEITPTFLRAYQKHLMTHYGNNLNTASKNLAGIRTIFRMAIREGDFPQEKNPFFQITLKTQKVTKKHLRPEEIDKIISYEVEPDSGIDRARDYFMFSFYLFGMRFSDVAMLKPEHLVHVGNDLRCVWTMGKVDREHGVLVVPPAKKIIERYQPGEYIFPILEGYDVSTPTKLRNAIESRNTRINNDLKKLKERAGIDTHISFHIARHSIVGYLLHKDWSIYDISKALGHSTIKQTETYLKGFDFGNLDDKMKGLWS